MITEDYCSYKTAKLLKEKGFEIDTNKDYWKIGEDGTMYFMCSIGAYTSNPNDKFAFYRSENSYPCPTLQMAMKWLREVHKIHIVIGWLPNAKLFFTHICNMNSGYPKRNPHEYTSYEDAVEAALKYSLENLI